MAIGARLPITTTPAEAGLAFEDVEFTATDGLGIKGWFIPAGSAAEATPAPTVLFVHGWLWNRMGNVAGRVPFTDADVDFLPSVQALHDAGFNVLLFDLCNHGESGSRPPITFGAWEARDFLGAVRLPAHPPRRRPRSHRCRGHVDGRATPPCSAAPYCQPLKALLIVQPTRAGQLHRQVRQRPDGPARHRDGAAGRLALRRRARPAPSQHDPAVAQRSLTDTMSSTSRAPATPGARCPRPGLRRAATPNALPLVEVPVDRTLRGLPLRHRAGPRRRSVLRGVPLTFLGTTRCPRGARGRRGRPGGCTGRGRRSGRSTPSPGGRTAATCPGRRRRRRGPGTGRRSRRGSCRRP